MVHTRGAQHWLAANGIYSPNVLEKLSKKSLSSVSSAEIAVISQRNEPSLLCFVGFDAFVLRLATLFRQSLEGAFCELRLDGVLGSSANRHSPKSIWRILDKTT